MQKNQQKEKSMASFMYPFPNPTPGEISIVALAPFPTSKQPKETESYLTKEDFDNVKSCGFNSVMFNASIDERGTDIYDNYKRAFEVIEGTGLKVVISGAQLLPSNKSFEIRNAYCSALVKKYRDNPLLGGWQVKDEPVWTNFVSKYPYNSNFENFDPNANAGPYIYLPYYFKMVRALDPDHPVFVNLAVSTSEYWIGNSPSYWDYLQYVQKKICPDIWSYDFYPIMENSAGRYFMKDQFYEWLETFRDISLQTGKPFWAYCRCYFKVHGTSWYPIPTVGELRLEAFNALAYGAQGIVYYRYAADEDNNPAPVDKDGNKTPIWNTVQEVNFEIARYNDIFSGCVVREVIHSNGKTVQLPEGPIEEINSAEDIVISRIENGYKNYYVFVSTNPFSPVQINFKKRSNPPSSWKAETDNLTPLYNQLPPANNSIMPLYFDEGGYGILSWD